MDRGTWRATKSQTESTCTNIYWLAVKLFSGVFKKNIYLFTWLYWVYLHHLGSFVAVCGLSSCATLVQLPCSTWNLSFPIRDGTHTPCIARWILNHWTTKVVPYLVGFEKRHSRSWATNIYICLKGKGEFEKEISALNYHRIHQFLFSGPLSY